jgi:undecaprenyl-diphosphatase
LRPERDSSQLAVILARSRLTTQCEGIAGMPIWQVLLLGLIEGLTEFIPVSSTGHLLLAGHFIGFESPKKVFEVLIQLGAILAILSVYAAKLLRLLVDLPRESSARRFVLGVLLAFLPAAVTGALLHSIIKQVLFESPILVCSTLIVGGIVLLLVDRIQFTVRYASAMDIPPLTALIIGLFQCLALVPGVSRSGSTIVGAMLMGTSKRAAAEFSFWLAMPTMAGAFAYDLYKNIGVLDLAAVEGIALGFVAAFITAVVVVRFLLDFVSRHGFALFGWWRLTVGGVALGALLILG